MLALPLVRSYRSRFYARTGAPLELSVAEEGHPIRPLTLGADLAAGQRPQGIVPKDAWQAAR